MASSRGAEAPQPADILSGVLQTPEAERGKPARAQADWVEPALAMSKPTLPIKVRPKAVADRDRDVIATAIWVARRAERPVNPNRK